MGTPSLRIHLIGYPLIEFLLVSAYLYLFFCLMKNQIRDNRRVGSVLFTELFEEIFINSD